MSITVRRLGSSDAGTLAVLAHDDPAYDLDGRGAPRTPLDPATAAILLADPNVAVWVGAIAGTPLAGFLYGHVLLKRAAPAAEFLLYEIGVHREHRRRGVGRALVQAMLAWTGDRGIDRIWVLADNPGAVAFYGALGFRPEPGDSTHMTHRRSGA